MGLSETRAKLTKRAVDAVSLPESGRETVWDTELKGFGLRLNAGSPRQPAGSKVYVVKLRVGSAQRWLTLGKHGSPWTPEQAREAAREALNRAAAGEDPAQAKREAREAPTVAGLIDAYLTEGPATKPAKRASTWVHDASNLNRHVRPLLGTRLAHTVTRADAARAVKDIATAKTAATAKTGPRGVARVRGGEGVARRTRAVAAACWAWGLDHGHVKGPNPFAGVKLTAAPERERFLSREEAGRFLDALAGLEGEGTLSGTFADALRLLLLTGARKTEVMGLRWSEVDFGRKLATLPPERTKAGGKTGVRRIALSPPALAVLSRRRAAWEALDASTRPPFVFAAFRGSGHAVGLRKSFLDVCGGGRGWTAFESTTCATRSPASRSPTARAST